MVGSSAATGDVESHSAQHHPSRARRQQHSQRELIGGGRNKGCEQQFYEWLLAPGSSSVRVQVYSRACNNMRIYVRAYIRVRPHTRGTMRNVCEYSQEGRRPRTRLPFRSTCVSNEHALRRSFEPVFNFGQDYKYVMQSHMYHE